MALNISRKLRLFIGRKIYNCNKKQSWQITKKESIFTILRLKKCNCQSDTLGYTHLYFKMAMIPLVPETKMVDIGKLISLRNLLVRKVTWFVHTTMSPPLILSHTFRADHMTRIAYLYSHFPRIHSLTFWLSEKAWPCHFVRQLNTHNMNAYTFCNLFLSSSTFSVRLVPALNIASEISSNPKRDKQPTWEKTHSS